MKTFSPSEAAFEGFRLIGRRPGLVLAWALLHLLFAILVIALVWAVFAPDMPGLMAQIAAAKTVAQGSSDPSWALPLMMKVRGLQWTVQPFGWIAMTIFTCAVYRALIRPQEGGFAYIRIGGDEFRLLALGVIYFVLGVIAAIALMVGAALTIGLGAAAAHASQSPYIALVVTVMVIAVVLVAIWVAVRLSLAWPISFAEKRIAIFDSWRLTRGNFWPMLGCYLLSWIFAIVLGLATLVVLGIVFMFGGGAIAAGLQNGSVPDWSKLAPLLVPLGLVWILVASAVGAMTRVVMTAPAMAIYRALTIVPDVPLASDGGSISTPPGVLVL
jgi:hypothetical protein